MRFIKLISILFSIGFSLFAQDGRLSIVDANSPIKIPRRDVEWLEFKIVNGSDFTLDTLRVEVGYEQGVRPLESVRWKGRASFSHAKGMIKNRGKRLLIFDLSNIGPRETIDMWAGFVGEKNGEYDFSINLYLLDESGN